MSETRSCGKVTFIMQQFDMYTITVSISKTLVFLSGNELKLL